MLSHKDAEDILQEFKKFYDNQSTWKLAEDVIKNTLFAAERLEIHLRHHPAAKGELKQFCTSILRKGIESGGESRLLGVYAAAEGNFKKARDHFKEAKEKGIDEADYDWAGTFLKENQKLRENNKDTIDLEGDKAEKILRNAAQAGESKALFRHVKIQEDELSSRGASDVLSLLGEEEIPTLEGKEQIAQEFLLQLKKDISRAADAGDPYALESKNQSKEAYISACHEGNPMGLYRLAMHHCDHTHEGNNVAIALLQEALKYNVHHATLGLAQIHERRGAIDEAANYYRQGTLSPDNTVQREAHNNLIRLVEKHVVYGSKWDSNVTFHAAIAYEGKFKSTVKNEFEKLAIQNPDVFDALLAKYPDCWDRAKIVLGKDIAKIVEQRIDVKIGEFVTNADAFYKKHYDELVKLTKNYAKHLAETDDGTQITRTKINAINELKNALLHIPPNNAAPNNQVERMQAINNFRELHQRHAPTLEERRRTSGWEAGAKKNIYDFMRVSSIILSILTVVPALALMVNKGSVKFWQTTGAVFTSDVSDKARAVNQKETLIKGLNRISKS